VLGGFSTMARMKKDEEEAEEQLRRCGSPASAAQQSSHAGVSGLCQHRSQFLVDVTTRLAATELLVLISLFDWKMFRSNPLKWRPDGSRFDC